ncbi:MAG: DUF2341 domain-containing protein [Spirochaetes bacterium]|nr:DUF2341 domain-containing protein [Spirochaetota bacterium]
MGIAALVLLSSCGFQEETNLLSLTVSIDQVQPTVVSITPADGSNIDSSLNEIVIEYSEAVENADTPGNYSLSGSGVNSLSVSGASETGTNTYTITLTGTPQEGAITLTISNIADSTGNPLSGNVFDYKGWWNTNWLYRKKITFDNSAQTENLVNFPVMVKLNGTRINYSHTNTNGEDIRFVDTDWSALSHEIEKWDAGGDSIIWVNIPQIDGASNSGFIWMYYGNSNTGDGQNPGTVWDSNYLSVWHLNNSSGAIIDSTSTGNNATNNGATFTTSGAIGDAYDFNGDGDIIETNSYTYSFGAEITLEGWFKFSGPGNGSPRILEISLKGDADSQCLAVDSTASLRAWLQIAGSRIGSVTDTTTYDDGNWHYMVYTYSSPNGTLYVDGTSTATVSDAGADIEDGSYLVIGAISDASGVYANTDHEFDGLIDEIRVSDKYKSADWVAAQYKSMSDSFITFGTEEE